MISDFLDSIPKDVLKRSQSLDLKVRSVNAHESIDLVLSRSVLNGGKRLRPLLTFLMAKLFKVDLDIVTPFARASELVHAASLSHDDVIDNATSRRGLPSINIVSSNKKAILAGDYLLSTVIVDLCSTGNLDLVKEMSLVIKDLSEGEWLQLDLIASRDYSRESIREVALKKTSSVMSFCTYSPSVLASMPREIQKYSYDLGVNLGLAFQLMDDTLDFSPESLKDQDLDLKNGIVNSVVFEFLDSRKDLMNRFKKGDDLSGLLESENLGLAIDIVTKLAQDHLSLSRAALNKIQEHLALNIYTEDKKSLKAAISQIETVFTYLGSRKN